MPKLTDLPELTASQIDNADILTGVDVTADANFKIQVSEAKKLFGSNLVENTPPVLGNFSWVNQGSATATNRSVDGALILTTPTIGTTWDLKSLVQNKPSATTYTITSRMKMVAQLASYPLCGVVLYESSTTKFLLYCIMARQNSLVQPWGYRGSNNAGTNEDLFTLVPGYMTGVEWIRIDVTASTITPMFSTDGVTWQAVASASITGNGHLTSGFDKIGIAAMNYNCTSYPNITTVYHWSVV